MAEARSQTSKSGTTTADRNGSKGGTTGLMAGAQDAADIVKTTAERAAERWPEAMAGAQTYARDTQRALEKMPNQGLVIGSSFSLGLGVGLFMTGANRLLVLLALAPAAAMAATLLGRDEETAAES
jgi:hypothetical protein